MTRVKVCGITNVTDALAAVDAGAHAIGLIFAESKRRITEECAAEIARRLPPFVACVGVFMNSHGSDEIRRIANELRLDAVQLHGEETPAFGQALRDLRVVKRIRVTDGDTRDMLLERIRDYDTAAYVLDPGAGGGRTFDWSIARDLPGPLILSGGLTPENVTQAVRVVRPYAVDVASGVEREPGRKDHALLRAFVNAVRNADDDHHD